MGNKEWRNCCRTHTHNPSTIKRACARRTYLRLARAWFTGSLRLPFIPFIQVYLLCNSMCQNCVFVCHKDLAKVQMITVRPAVLYDICVSTAECERTPLPRSKNPAALAGYSALTRYYTRRIHGKPGSVKRLVVNVMHLGRGDGGAAVHREPQLPPRTQKGSE